MQDWTDPEAAVVLNGSPVLMFDCGFRKAGSTVPVINMVQLCQELVAFLNLDG